MDGWKRNASAEGKAKTTYRSCARRRRRRGGGGSSSRDVLHVDHVEWNPQVRSTCRHGLQHVHSPTYSHTHKDFVCARKCAHTSLPGPQGDPTRDDTSRPGARRPQEPPRLGATWSEVSVRRMPSRWPRASDCGTNGRPSTYAYVRVGTKFR